MTLYQLKHGCHLARRNQGIFIASHEDESVLGCRVDEFCSELCMLFWASRRKVDHWNPGAFSVLTGHSFRIKAATWKADADSKVGLVRLTSYTAILVLLMLIMLRSMLDKDE